MRYHAEAPRDTIHLFGRFPHGNRIPGCPSTPEKTAFLRDGGFAQQTSPARRRQKSGFASPIAPIISKPSPHQHFTGHRATPCLPPRRPVIPVL
ncbi:hypothetical protein [Chromobacterium piscinae]|uniref:hypothetical protein n=1 Tax=Chromobacterium piscinae TaxID=686831 RepID=UPI003525BA14